jgi:hypothetical protein
MHHHISMLDSALTAPDHPSAGIPSDATDEELRHFFNNLMLRSGALTSPGSSILSCRINHDKSYAFIEFRWG